MSVLRSAKLPDQETICRILVKTYSQISARTKLGCPMLSILTAIGKLLEYLIVESPTPNVFKEPQ